MPRNSSRPRRAPSTRTVLTAASWSALVVVDLLNGDLGLSLAALAAFVAMALGVSRFRPQRAWTWLFILGAFVLFTVGGVLRESLNTVGNLTANRSLVPDFVVLPGYLALGAAYVGWIMSRTHATKNRIGIVTDGLIAGLAMFACTWAFVMVPVLSRRAVPLDIRLILAAYPALSCCLAVTVLQYAFSAGRRWTPAERFFVCAMGAMFVGDSLYMLAELALVHLPASLLDLPYVVAYAGAGSCASTPTMVQMTRPERENARDWSLGRILLVALAFTVPALLVLQARRESLDDRIVVFGLVVALTGAAILQLVRALFAAARSEARLTDQALHDSLTGLPNRRFLERFLNELFEDPERHGVVAVLFLDLDRFKLINDSMGHSHGDALIIDVAERLTRHLARGDLVARVGGDEFLIVLTDLDEVDKAHETANALRRMLHEPFTILGTDFYVTGSIGVACTDLTGQTASVEALVRDADTAMYRAKEAGRDAVALFDDSMRASLARKVDLERDLHRAIDHEELHLVFQPVVDTKAHRLRGVEALVRWVHPELGVISPGTFIPVAEESNLIIEIGSFVLEKAVAEIAALRNRPGLAELTVAVNLSAAQLRDEHLIERIERALCEHHLPGHALCLELTETVVMRDYGPALRLFEALHGLDVKLAIDDFGTEYSSLAYLQRLPVDSLKIDQSFVADLDRPDTSSESVVAAIIAVADALGIATIAEGVERPEQAERLSALGCTSLQGYLFCHPVRSELLPDVVGLLAPAFEYELANLEKDAAVASGTTASGRPPASTVRAGLREGTE